MDDEQRITIKEVIDLIGDEIGNKYTWFIIGFDSHGDIRRYMDGKNIREILNP